MVDELGIASTERVQQLEHAILASDPALDLPSPLAEVQPVKRHVPNVLPADIADFTGRTEEIGRIYKHLIPATGGEVSFTAPIVVQATLLLGTAIVTEAALSFLGVGVQPPTPSWGAMLRTGSQYLEVAPWIGIAPGVAIFLTVLAFNFVGDGLRRALDPRLAGRRRQ